MRRIYLACVLIILAACGGRTKLGQPAIFTGDSCEEAADCTCPTDYEASCDSNQCLCLKTETTEVPVEVGCEADTDCNCSEGYEALCQEGGQCYCNDLSQECYPLVRGEFTHQFMSKLIDLEKYVPKGQTFPDVPSNHEYYVAIEAAAEYGFVNTDVEFRPEDTLNRAEGSKFVIVGINGLEGFTPPAMETYFDVMLDTWFFDYVEAATKLELTKGYVNQDGSPTGYFGPGDTASSCFMDAMMAHAEFPELQSGFSIAIETINHSNRIAIAGQTEMLSVRYLVHGTSVSNPLNKLKFINEPNGEGTGPQPTQAIAQVWVSCPPPSGSGNSTFFAGQLDSNGVVQFTGLNCYDETGNGLEVSINYDVSTFAMIGEGLSGQLFRLVLDDLQLMESQANVPVNTVRKTKVQFNNVSINPTLGNGERILIGIAVTAHSAGSAGFARLVYEISPLDSNANGSLKLTNLKMYRGSTLIVNAKIFDANGNDLTGGASPTTSKIIVSFISEEVVSAGSTQTYSLKATVTGSETNDSITTWLDPGDEGLPVSGKTADTTPNTAKLVSSVFTEGLFMEVSFFQAVELPYRNIIWSDHSADAHIYSIADSVSSFDWTNGYALDVHLVNSVTISKN